MSLERAYVNCKRCYELLLQSGVARDVVTHTPCAAQTAGFVYSARKGPDYFCARNETLRALEEEVSTYQLSSAPISQIVIFSVAKEALNVCANCIYDEPKVAELVSKFVELKK